MKQIFLSILFCLIIMSCCPKDFDPSMVTVYVDKVYMNEISRYTFITKQKNGESKVWQLQYVISERTHIYEDVPPNKRMYVEYCNRCSGGSILPNIVNIHIHSLDEIQGGSWNHGKFGKGQTQVIR